MFSNGRDGQVSVVKVLVGINAAVFVLESLFAGGHTRWINALFGLSLSGLSHGMVWQLITYQFLHAGLFHIMANMFGLWFAGRVLENLMGPWRFLAFYLACGIAGGLLQILLVPGPMLIGASGAVCGVVAAFAALYPELQITALLFFVLPIRMRAKWLGYGIIIVSVVLIITGLGGDIGNAAHLGGALAGYAYVWFGRRPRFRVVR